MLDEEQVRELFETRCADLVIPFKEHQLKKFEAKLNEMSFNRKLNLTNMLIGPRTAALLAHWILQGTLDITHLYLG